MADVAKLKLNGTTYNIKDANVRAKIPIYVQDYGAVGDGATNDRNALQNAINAAIAQHRPLEFESGKKYVIRSALEITYPNSQQHLIINGNDAEIHIYDGADWLKIYLTDTYGGKTGNKAFNWFTYVTIRDLTVQTYPLDAYLGTAVSFGTSEKPCLDGKISLENVRITGFKYGFTYYNARNIYLNNCSCVTQYPFRFVFVKPLSDFADALFSGDSFFSFCTFNVKNSGTLIIKSNPNSVTNQCNISGLHFSHCDFYGASSGAYIDITSADIPTSARCYDWFFDNCQWDQINKSLFNFATYGNNSSGLINNIVVSNCYGYYITRILRAAGATAITINNSYFRLGTSTSPDDASTINPVLCETATVSGSSKQAKGIVFSNNFIDGMSTQPIYLTGCSNVSITGNVIKNKAWTAFQLASTTRTTITGNVIEDDSSVESPRIYYLGSGNTGYNISGNTNSSTAIAQ